MKGTQKYRRLPPATFLLPGDRFIGPFNGPQPQPIQLYMHGFQVLADDAREFFRPVPVKGVPAEGTHSVRRRTHQKLTRGDGTQNRVPDGRGGKREGAGRPSTGRKAATLRLEPCLRRHAARYATLRGLDVSTVVNAALRLHRRHVLRRVMTSTKVRVNDLLML